ncbi:hypothetical protein D3C75_739080 [compost metagenome]
MEGVGRGYGIRVGGHDVARLAAPYHGQQYGGLGEIGATGDGERYGGDSDNGHVHEDADRGQDQGGQRQRQQGTGLAELANYGLGDGGGGPRFDQDACQHTGRQDPHHGRGDPLGAADHQGDGLGQVGAADQATGQGTDYHAVGRRHLLQNEEDGDGERSESTERGYRDHDGHLEWK